MKSLPWILALIALILAALALLEIPAKFSLTALAVLFLAIAVLLASSGLL